MRRAIVIVAALASGVLAGCTGNDVAKGPEPLPQPLGAVRLVAFDTCEDALQELRAAAKDAVGPYGLHALFPPPMLPEAAMDSARGATKQTEMTPAYSSNYSRTNTHEAGVDEPDLVKTNGRRIVALSGGTLHVIDAASRRLVGSLRLFEPGPGRASWVGANLLLSGDHALVIANQPHVVVDLGVPEPLTERQPSDVRPAQPPARDVVDADSLKDADPSFAPRQPPRERLLLVDVSGAPRLLSTMTIDGAVLDARHVNDTARVVVRTFPRLSFPQGRGDEASRIKANRKIIDQAGLDAWLPRIEVTTGTTTRHVTVKCGDISRPQNYSGASLLTVLTFNLAASDLGDGQPVSVVADGDTVYSNGPSLYVANDLSWLGQRPGLPKEPEPYTEVFKFDTSSPGRPRYVASGRVPGFLVNQYALSEWDGHLRVATTKTTTVSGTAAGEVPPTQSGVYVLAHKGSALVEVGRVEGLGKGEHIYAVRFVGPIGFVVTFRQVDPLYTVDLSDPSRPRVRGELKIPGFSSYLHPLDATRLIGVGQDADSRGVTRGAQVSLFDVSNLDAPRRVATYPLEAAHTEAGNDPHAFLYWAPERLLALPVQGRDVGRPFAPAGGLLLLRVNDASFDWLGLLTHSDDMGWWIRRSLVIDQTLWTFSEAGAMATDLGSLARLAWIPL